MFSQPASRSLSMPSFGSTAANRSPPRIGVSCLGPIAVRYQSASTRLRFPASSATYAAPMAVPIRSKDCSDCPVWKRTPSDWRCRTHGSIHTCPVGPSSRRMIQPLRSVMPCPRPFHRKASPMLPTHFTEVFLPLLACRSWVTVWMKIVRKYSERRSASM
ncbi:hypothetical protein AXK60_10400 [Tsukamurella pseudospumae]|uniref:Uncharacterized protein n=1 Tax=Tsukamurella pseudospumae TaxID=239498 RepID=A0A138A7Q8_9ACTN|nr:hypothetical protein AXK60_10400 [Tsukamurella pseudospumae]